MDIGATMMEEAMRFLVFLGAQVSVLTTTIAFMNTYKMLGTSNKFINKLLLLITSNLMLDVNFILKT